MVIEETADLSRVYLPEWLLSWTAFTPEDCVAMFADRYAERVRDEDWKVARDDYSGRYALLLRLPNLLAEFKTRARADEYAARYPGAVVVTRNSRAEQLLRDYGVKKLIDNKKET